MIGCVHTYFSSGEALKVQSMDNGDRIPEFIL